MCCMVATWGGRLGLSFILNMTGWEGAQVITSCGRLTYSLPGAVNQFAVCGNSGHRRQPQLPIESLAPEDQLRQGLILELCAFW